MVDRIEQVGRSLPVSANENRGQVNRPSQGGANPSFAEVLNKTIGEQTGLKFSHHAQQRMEKRNIQLSGEAMSKVEKAVQTAKEKGSKDSLVLLDNIALLVSVKNNTVVTAVDREKQPNKVFTNIDSVILA